MLRRDKHFAYILLLEYFTICAALKNEDNELDNVIQSKNIHIVDLQGTLGSVEINATYKDIRTINFAGKSNESILSDFIGTNLMQSPVAQTEDLTAIIGQLQAQINNLNDSVIYLKKLISMKFEEKKATSCSLLDIFDSDQLINVPGIAPFVALCHSRGAEAGWIVIQRRFDGSLGFYRDWSAYRNGFGFYNGEFFLGLEYIYRLTKSRPYELYIELVDFKNQMYYARYDSFLIGSEEEQYMLKSLGAYSGNAGDSLKYNLYDKFSTYDNDNDRWPRGNCANYYESGWWYNWDANSNLNGRYFKSGEKNVKGIWWYTMRGYYSLKSVKMSIRPKYTLV
ncbi:angiopoietin-related protein 1 [Drosophila virilis]|uniref:Fibrinogen C-terminal domain-containing protein n=1 Tax=Drosophila virilis TaxID=7244 RepID=B4LIC2_DROVI|nr:angiopoietin-related protein 1 [Drosophila virilis]EDW70709.2 uncharacterized protein Dvir_GJ11388 [Drosophila virilis]